MDVQRSGGLAVCVVLMLSLVGCTSEVDLEQFRDQSFAVYAAEPSEEGHLAEVRGNLTLSGGCLTLVETYEVSGEGGEIQTEIVIVVPEFPSFLEPHLERPAVGPAVLHLGDLQFTIGEYVSWRSGGHRTVDEARVGDVSPPRMVPDACPGDLDLITVEGVGKASQPEAEAVLSYLV